jgi:hypothetical protein
MVTLAAKHMYGCDSERRDPLACNAAYSDSEIQRLHSGLRGIYELLLRRRSDRTPHADHTS